MCVCPKAINNYSDMKWRDMNSIRLVNKFYNRYMATVAVIVNGHGVSVVDANPLRVS